MWHTGMWCTIRCVGTRGVERTPCSYCVRCDGIEKDVQHVPEGILKWYVRNFCFRERRTSQRWVMHRAGVGDVFCEVLIAGELKNHVGRRLFPLGTRRHPGRSRGTPGKRQLFPLLLLRIPGRLQHFFEHDLDCIQSEWFFSTAHSTTMCHNIFNFILYITLPRQDNKACKSCTN